MAATKRTTKKPKPPAETPAAPPAKLTAAQVRETAITHLTAKLHAGTIVALELKMLLDLTGETEEPEPAVPFAAPSDVPFPAAPFPVGDPAFDNLPFKPGDGKFTDGTSFPPGFDEGEQ